MPAKIVESKKNIYLDHAATTYLDPRVKKAMEPFWIAEFGNPSSLYKKGRQGELAVNGARKTIGKLIGAKSEEIIFTAGGTESINLAIFGVARNFELLHKKKGHIITSAVEHHAVLHSVEALEQEGWQASFIGVDTNGFIKLDELKAAVRPDTVLISVMLANNEIGTIEPIAEIAKWLGKLNAERVQKKLHTINLHTDACQAAGFLEMNVAKLGVDLMTVNGSKIYGPKQTGFLFVKTGVKLRPLIFGGGQEKNLRGGTENVPGIAGLAEALKLAQKIRLKENKRLQTLRNYLTAEILKSIPDALLNGPGAETDSESHPTRLPNNASVSFKNVEGEALMLYLDAEGIAVSTGSACSTGSTDPSHVLKAIGRSVDYSYGTLRLTLGRATTKKDLDYTVKILSQTVKQLRTMAAHEIN